MVTETILDPMIARRDGATQAIVSSPHHCRVVVAGPGTGKTFTFKKALEQRGGRGLALTFLRLLGEDLKASLASQADAFTFHGFARYRMKAHTPSGLTSAYELYPSLATLETWDLGLLGVLKIPSNPGPKVFGRLRARVESSMQMLDFKSGLPDAILSLGTYYDAVAFSDLVLRMYLEQKDDPSLIPTYPLVVVDEYQDFSPLEVAIIDQLRSKSDVLIAGDDDQALYAFREASPDAIRALANDANAERHELPFCSRCTAVVVEAVASTLVQARAIGKLPGRLEKPFECYLPSKAEDSAAHPKIFDVRCTSGSYMGPYVAAKIAEIPESEIAEAKAGGYPTVLVIGPAPFLGNVGEYLTNYYPEAQHKPGNGLPVLPIDGYRLLARDPSSNLGWRILVHLLRPAGWQEAVRSAIQSGQPLVAKLAGEFRADHEAVARQFKAARDGQVDESGLQELSLRLGVERDALDELLVRGGTEEEAEEAGREGEPVTLMGEEEVPTGSEAADEKLQPTILFTSLLGAKGLSAAYVFVVGCSNGHFPRTLPPDDVEICEFLVALSRTRKACHLVSCQWLGGPLSHSIFLDWIAGQTQVVRIDKRNVGTLALPDALNTSS